MMGVAACYSQLSYRSWIYKKKLRTFLDSKIDWNYRIFYLWDFPCLYLNYVSAFIDSFFKQWLDKIYRRRWSTCRCWRLGRSSLWTPTTPGAAGSSNRFSKKWDSSTEQSGCWGSRHRSPLTIIPRPRAKPDLNWTMFELNYKVFLIFIV